MPDIDLTTDDLIELAEGMIDLADDMIDAGGDEDETISAVARFGDGLVDWRHVFPGAFGEAAEAGDGPAIEAVARVLRDLVRVDPRKRAIRRQSRLAMREALEGVKGRRRRKIIRRTFHESRRRSIQSLDAA